MRTFVYLPGANEHINLARLVRMEIDASGINPVAVLFLSDGTRQTYEGLDAHTLDAACRQLGLDVDPTRPEGATGASIAE